MSSLRTRLDAAQVLQEVYDSATESLRTSGAPPVGGATEVLQQDQLIELQAINQNTDEIEPKLNEIKSKIGAVLITEPFDNIQITYVGITTNINTVTYKLGITTVATLTLGYDGSDRLTSVTRS